MMPYVFFLDIDDTLTLYRRPMSDYTRAVLTRARAAGHRVFINTGRAPSYLPADLRAFPFDGFVCGCGAYLELGGTVLQNEHLSPDACLRLCERFSAPGDPGVLLEGVHRFFRYRTSRWLPESNWILGETLAQVRDYLETDSVTKINLNDTFPDAVLPELERDFYVIRHPSEFYTECCVRGCTKATGIRTVMEHYGLPMSRSVAVGDSENDREMIEAAGIGIVMGQAGDALKQIADRVTDTAERDGAAKAIESFL